MERQTLPKASQLKLSDNVKAQFAKQANDIIFTIGDDIKKAHNEGKTYIRFQVPSAFTINGDVGPTITKLEIHYLIVKKLKENGYDVIYDDNEDRVILLIKWISIEEINAQKEKIDFLNKHKGKS